MKPPKSEPFNETEYLLSSKENTEHLAQSIKQLRKGKTLAEICSDKDV